MPDGATPSTESATAIVLFDGVCNLCNGAVQFILDRDSTGRFRFASLQSERGRAICAEHGVPVPEGDPDSIILVEGARIWSHSTAALRIARHLSFPWFLGYAAIAMPRFLRDAVYRFIARNRYRWFGKTNECRIPTPEIRARMLG
jgi:predicted DCC family thiol-disulfide oxidoreductase YuxK